MTRIVRWLLPACLLTAVVVVTVLAAGSIDRSALGRALPVSALPTSAVQPPAPVACALTSGAAGDDAVTVSGSCEGAMSASAPCTGDDALSGTVRADVEGGSQFTLTLVLPDPHGPGDYDGAALYAQLSRPGGAERWSDRDLALTLDEDGRVQIDTTLPAEVATGTPGPVELHGAFHCMLGDDS